MRKKFLTKTVGIMLSAAVALTSIPVNVSASTSETVAAETVETQTETENKTAIEDIFTFDWKTATIDEINEAVYAADFQDLGVWLKSLPDAEYEELLAMDTYLHNEVQLLSYDEEDGSTEPIEIDEDGKLELWEFAISQIPVNQKATQDVVTKNGYYFSKTTGSYYYTFHINNVSYSYKMAISDVSKTTNARSSADTVTLAFVVPSGVPSWLNVSSTAGVTDTDRKLKESVSYGISGNYGYCCLRNAISFTKPAGYTCSYVKVNGNYSSLWDYDSGNYATSQKTFTGSTNTASAERYGLLGEVNLLDTGISIVNGEGTSVCASPGVLGFDFWLNPITYYMAYNGNGATSGSVGTQTCKYDQSYTPSANNFSRTYTISYNANGGSATKSSESLSYTFAGWGLNNGNSVTHTTSTAFSNVTTTNGATAGTFYAIWTPKSTSLATATRTGYTFAGWKNSANNQTYSGGSSYTPTASSTMTAQWTANKYTLTFNSNGGEEVEDITATYDSNVTLPTPERAGYKFLGWSGAGGTYSGTVKNLSSTNNATVSMTALWEVRTDIPYKVVHMVEAKDETTGETSYIEKEVEELTGTTGDSVTPAVKEYDGYISPALQTKTINGDGSTVFTYEYKLDKKYTTYKVEHYLQNKDDTTQYDLDEENSGEYGAEVGESVTPDVITTYEGYNIPNPQTVTVAENGSTVVKYYYTLKEGTSSNSNSTNNSSHVSESTQSTDNAYSDINNFKSGEIKYYTDAAGNVYTIYVNPDGTLTIRDIKMAKSSATTMTVAGTITVNGVKYQVSEIAPWAFKNNKKIKTITIGKGITKIGTGAFYGCTKLKTVKGCSTLTVIGSKAFYKCTSLEKMASSKTLTEIGSKAFYNCKKLKSYTIGKYTKTIGSYAFYNCKKLKSMTISESVEIINQKAFYGCKNLKKVTIKSTKLLKVGKAAFKKCNKKLTFKLPGKKEKAYKKLLKNKV